MNCFPGTATPVIPLRTGPEYRGGSETISETALPVIPHLEDAVLHKTRPRVRYVRIIRNIIWLYAWPDPGSKNETEFIPKHEPNENELGITFFWQRNRQSCENFTKHI